MLNKDVFKLLPIGTKFSATLCSLTSAKSKEVIAVKTSKTMVTVENDQKYKTRYSFRSESDVSMIETGINYYDSRDILSLDKIQEDPEELIEVDFKNTSSLSLWLKLEKWEGSILRRGMRTLFIASDMKTLLCEIEYNNTYCTYKLFIPKRLIDSFNLFQEL